mgnify:CR=1 FL=1
MPCRLEVGSSSEGMKKAVAGVADGLVCLILLS